MAELVNYLGRMVQKDNFRTFIYSAAGEKSLVESWDDFQDHMATGIWFAEPYIQPIDEKVEIIRENRIKSKNGKK